LSIWNRHTWAVMNDNSQGQTWMQVVSSVDFLNYEAAST